jgi:hypothetical protein
MRWSMTLVGPFICMLAVTANAQYEGFVWHATQTYSPYHTGHVNAMTLWDPDGPGPQAQRIVAAGSFNGLGNQKMAGVGYYDGEGWVRMAHAASAPDQGFTAACVHNGELILGGTAASIDGTTGLQGLVRNNGTGWSTFLIPAPGFTAPIKALASFQGKLYAGGLFTEVPGPDTGGLLAVWDGAAWRNVAGGLYSTFPTAGCVLSLHEHQGRLIIGGTFTRLGESTPTRCIAAWDGTAWDTLAGGLNGMVSALTTWNGQLVAAGAFTQTMTGAPANHVASWNGAAWTDMGAGLSPTGWAAGIAATGSGQYPGGYAGGFGATGGDLYLVGSFPVNGSAGNRSMARWDGGRWVLPTQGPVGWAANAGYGRCTLQLDGSFIAPSQDVVFPGGPAFPVSVVEVGADAFEPLIGHQPPAFVVPLGDAVSHNGETYGVASNAIVKWNGNRWLNVPVGAPGAAWVWRLWSDPLLGLAATGEGGIRVLDGSVWTTIGSVNGSVRGFARVGTDVYIIGTFSSVNGQPGFNNVARFDGQSWHALPLGGQPSEPATEITGFEGELWYTGSAWVTRYTPASGWGAPAHMSLQDIEVIDGWLYQCTDWWNSSLSRRRNGVTEWIPEPFPYDIRRIAAYRGHIFASARHVTSQSAAEVLNTGVYTGSSWASMGLAGQDGLATRASGAGDWLVLWYQGLYVDDKYCPGIAFFGPVHACDSLDFNNDGLYPDNADLVDFLSVFGGGACSTGTCQDIDFNNDGLYPDNEDLIGYLRVFGGGACVE